MNVVNIWIFHEKYLYSLKLQRSKSRLSFFNTFLIPALGRIFLGTLGVSAIFYLDFFFMGKLTSRHLREE